MSSRSPKRSAEQWRALIAEYRAGSESDAAFCRRLRLNFHTFRKHKYAHGKTRMPAVAPAFKEIQLESVSRRALITVHARDGVRIDVPLTMDMCALAQLVQALQHGR